MPDDRTYGFNKDDAEALIQGIGTGEVLFLETKPRGGGARVTGKLDGDLAAATDFSTSPGTATMSIWSKNASGNMVDSTKNITVVNRFLYISLLADTIVEAHYIDGEWRVSAADCEAT